MTHDTVEPLRLTFKQHAELKASSEPCDLTAELMLAIAKRLGVPYSLCSTDYTTFTSSRSDYERFRNRQD